MKKIFEQKARQSQRCFEYLQSLSDLEDSAEAVFCYNSSRFPQLLMACFRNNPFPKYRIVLLMVRLLGILKLFKTEKKPVFLFIKNTRPYALGAASKCLKNLVNF